MNIYFEEPEPITITPCPGINATITVIAGIPGPATNSGGGGGDRSSDLILIAAESIGGHRFVSYNSSGRVELAQPNISSLLRLAGMTLGAASSGAEVVVRAFGAILEPSWTWTAGGRIYLGPSGTATQMPPVSGPIQVLGVALSPTRINLESQTLVER